jgi:hypothetical protein
MTHFIKMSKPGTYKQIKTAKSKLAGVLFHLQVAPLTEKEWKEMCEIYGTLGKIRAEHMAWLQQRGGKYDAT